MKLRRRIDDVKKLEPQTMSFRDQQRKTVEAAIQDAIREIYGSNSPECHRYGHHNIWEGGVNLYDDDDKRQRKFAAGIPKTISMLEGLIAQLDEKKADLEAYPEVVDEAIDVQEKSTTLSRPPMPPPNIYNFHQMTGIVSFGERTINIQKQYVDVAQVLRELASAVELASLNPEQKQKAQAKIATIEAQLADPEPDSMIVQRAYAGMNFLATVGGCADLLVKLAGLLGPFLHG